MNRKATVILILITVTVTSTLLAFKQGWINVFTWENLIKEDKAGAAEVIESTESASSAFEEMKKPIYFKPETLQITRPETLEDGTEIEVEILSNILEEIGLDSSGGLDVPSSWYTLGWYKRSAKPGENGNVIIDGHYNTNTGAPAAFWELKNVKLNDKVTIRDELNRSFTYTVTDIFYVEISDPDRTRIFDEAEDKSELTLITCGGVWDYQKGTYDKRLVVKAELTDSDAS